MDSHSTKLTGDAVAPELFAGEEWFDPLEAGVRLRIRGFIEAMLESELDAALSRGRYERRLPSGEREQAGVGHRHGHRERSLTGTFGPVRLRVPRARLATSDGGTAEWKNATIPAYQRRTRQAEALIAGAYLAGANTRRVRRALGALFGDSVGKDTVSRAWRKAKTDWEAWNRRDLSNEPIVRLILDGTAVRVRLDRKATSISLLVVLGVRADGQNILLAVKNMGGESEAAWRGVLDDLVRRGLRTPELVIVDGGSGLERALAALWDRVPTGGVTGGGIAYPGGAGLSDCHGGQDDDWIIADWGDGFQCHVAGALDGPFVVLFHEDGSDEADDGVLVWERFRRHRFAA